MANNNSCVLSIYFQSEASTSFIDFKFLPRCMFLASRTNYIADCFFVKGEIEVLIIFERLAASAHNSSPMVAIMKFFMIST